MRCILILILASFSIFHSLYYVLYTADTKAYERSRKEMQDASVISSREGEGETKQDMEIVFLHDQSVHTHIHNNTKRNQPNTQNHETKRHRCCVSLLFSFVFS